MSSRGSRSPRSTHTAVDSHFDHHVVGHHVDQYIVGTIDRRDSTGLFPSGIDCRQRHSIGGRLSASRIHDGFTEPADS